jgi:hypothetical protein
MGPLLDLCEEVELLEASGTVEGGIEFLADTFEQDAVVSLQATIYVPVSCGHLGKCLLMQAGAIQQGLTGTQCENDSDNADDCVCTAPLGGTVMTNGAYSTDGTTLTLDGEDHEYCADGGSFSYTGSTRGIPFVYETVAQ